MQYTYLETNDVYMFKNSDGRSRKFYSRLDVENGTPRTLSVQSRGRTPFCERKIEDAAISPEFTSRPPHRKQWEGHMHVPYAFPI